MQVANEAWPWEGSVQRRIREYLESEGWTVVAEANAADRTHGRDLDARMTGRMLLIEVKGYPSTEYRDPRRTGDRKRTNPKLQAHHWFAQAVLKAIEMGDGLGIETAIGLPDDPNGRYEELVSGVEVSLHALGIGVYMVPAEEPVWLRLPHRTRAEVASGASR